MCGDEVILSKTAMLIEFTCNKTCLPLLFIKIIKWQLSHIVICSHNCHSKSCQASAIKKYSVCKFFFHHIDAGMFRWWRMCEINMWPWPGTLFLTSEAIESCYENEGTILRTPLWKLKKERNTCDNRRAHHFKIFQTACQVWYISFTVDQTWVSVYREKIQSYPFI